MTKTVRKEDLDQVEADVQLGYIIVEEIIDNGDGTYTVVYRKGARR